MQKNDGEPDQCEKIIIRLFIHSNKKKTTRNELIGGPAL